MKNFQFFKRFKATAKHLYCLKFNNEAMLQEGVGL